jgi:hypothetical protein
VYQHRHLVGVQAGAHRVGPDPQSFDVVNRVAGKLNTTSGESETAVQSGSQKVDVLWDRGRRAVMAFLALVFRLELIILGFSSSLNRSAQKCDHARRLQDQSEDGTRFPIGKRPSRQRHCRAHSGLLQRAIAEEQLTHDRVPLPPDLGGLAVRRPPEMGGPECCR